MMIRSCLPLLGAMVLAACAGRRMLPAPQHVDLAVTHATLLEVRTGQTLPETTVLGAWGNHLCRIARGVRRPRTSSSESEA